MKELKLTPREIVEELREQAQQQLDDANEGIPESMVSLGLARFTIDDMLETDAADCIEEMLGAFQQISDGAGDPKEIASTFLGPMG